MDAPASSDTLVVSVRTLCEFAGRRGDLDLRFAAGPSALEGIAGHAQVRSSRAPGYEREIRLEGRFGPLQVRGRADGYDPCDNLLEEIKTHRRGDAPAPANQVALHWAQAKAYGWLLCEARSLAELDVALVYFDLGTQRETVLRERHPADALKIFFEGLCQRFLDWAREQIAHRRERDRALQELRFPHAQFREGQRKLAEAVYRANLSGRCLLAQAPTGIGKTIATLFPALRAMPQRQIDKVFYLTARTPGRQLALDALGRLLGERSRPTPAPYPRARHDAPLRVLELVAREKSCEHPDKACHGESCPLAAGFHDRLPQARQSAAAAQWLDRNALRRIALEHSVCPYYLGQEMARWSDVIVGDYNHFFGLGALLHGLTAQEGLRVSVLADEAHNLVDRARSMYTAAMRLSELKASRKEAPATLRRPLGALQRRWPAIDGSRAAGYRIEEPLPAAFRTALRNAGAACGNHFAKHPAQNDSRLLSWYFDLLRFERIAELHGPHSVCDVTHEYRPDGHGPPDPVVCVRNVIPAPLLEERWATLHSATLFSATLAPVAHHIELLGLPDSTACIDVPSPFRCGQLAARVVRSVSTRYRDRQRSLDAVVAIIATQYQERPGNYLAFLSSFDYLQAVAERLARLHPQIGIWLQSPRMTEAQRDQFLARFTESSQGVGFAVLGGAFAEGIDLPGARLIGAFVATLGMPQVNPVNEQFMRQIDARLGRGYEHTYLYPGIRKVVQAAGRVVRTPQDQGIVYLIDDRYSRSAVRRLLPDWWAIEVP